MTDALGFGDLPDDATEGLTEHQSESTVLAALIADLKTGTPDDAKWYPVPERPSITLGFDTNIDFDTLQGWTKRATDRRTKRTNVLALARIIMSQQSVGMMHNGIDVTKDGEPVTLVNPFLWEQFGANSAPQAMKALFKKEGHIIACMQQILEDAGYGDVDMEAEDPLAQD